MVLLIRWMIIWMVLGVEEGEKVLKREESEKVPLFLALVSWYMALPFFFFFFLRQSEAVIDMLVGSVVSSLQNGL